MNTSMGQISQDFGFQRNKIHLPKTIYQFHSPRFRQNGYGGVQGDMIKALSAPMLFDYMAIVMDKQALADHDFTMNVTLPDVGEQHMLRIKNGVMLVYENSLSDKADISITCPKNALFAILTNNKETVKQAVKAEGNTELLTLMMENMNQFPITGTNPFNIIEP